MRSRCRKPTANRRRCRSLTYQVVGTVRVNDVMATGPPLTMGSRVEGQHHRARRAHADVHDDVAIAVEDARPVAVPVAFALLSLVIAETSARRMRQPRRTGR